MTPEQNRLRLALERADKGPIDFSGGGGPSSRNLGQRIERSKPSPSGRKANAHFGIFGYGRSGRSVVRPEPGIRAEQIA